MKKWTVVVCAAALVTLGGLVLAEDKLPQRPAPDKAPPPVRVSDGAAKAKRDGEFQIIGYLEKHDRVIAIKSGPKGTVYGVATKDGKVLFENLSSEQLKAQAPEIHILIKTAVAGDARVRSSKIDASLRISAER